MTEKNQQLSDLSTQLTKERERLEHEEQEEGVCICV